MVPHRRVRGDLDNSVALAIPAGDLYLLPRRVRIIESGSESGQALAFQPWSAHLADLTFWRGFIECRVQPQTGDDGNGLVLLKVMQPQRSRRTRCQPRPPMVGSAPNVALDGAFDEPSRSTSYAVVRVAGGSVLKASTR